MTEVSQTHSEVSLPTLLRMARAAYGTQIRGALAAGGYDDIPESGLLVIGVIAGSNGVALSRLIQSLSVSKQVAGQLIDTLVQRGYATREVDADDRRCLTIAPTARGRAAGKIMRTVIERIEADLAARVGPDALAQTRATLQSLIERDHE